MNRVVLLWFIVGLFAAIAVAEQFSYKFTLPTNLVLVNTVVNGTSLRLTSPYSGYAGLAYYPTKVSANLGFSTNFTWVPESCSVPAGAEGFAFFFTKDAPTYQQVSNSVDKGLGISKVPNTYMVGYSASVGQLYVCDWTTPLADTFDVSSQCTVVNIAKVQCGGSMNIKINFNGAFWTVYNNDMLLVTVAKGMDLDHYYVGLSGSTGALYFKQSITQWSFQSTTSGFTDLPLSTMTSNIKFYGDAIPTSDGALRLTTSGSQAGAVLYNEWIILRTGFKTSFTWSPSNCDAEYNGADGFAFVAVPYLSNSSVIQSQGSGLGIQYAWGNSELNVVMAAYSATFNEFYICNWTDPRPDLFRYVCYTVVNPNPKFTCGSNYSIEVAYIGNTLSMSVDGQVQIATTDVVFNSKNYYFGLTGATGGGWFQQDIYDWSFRSSAVELNYGYLSVGIGAAVFNSSDTRVILLTNGPNQAGAVYSSGWEDIRFQFESSFTWTGSDCFGTPSRGFSYFFSRLAPTASQIQTSPDELGIGNVDDVYMMGYDVEMNSLLICDWGASPTGFSSTICSTATMPSYVCDTSLNFKFTYDAFSLKVYVNDTFTISRSVTIFPRLYYSGFTAIATNSFTQQISGYQLSITAVTPTQQYVYYGLPDTATFLGSAGTVLAPWNFPQLKLTNGFYSDENAGLMLSPTPLTMKYGFTAASYWNASSCDPVQHGGDGFAFVFTTAVPSNSSVLASNGTGLGIQQVPNVSMVGYSSYYNEFYVCSWASPLVGSYRDNPACQNVSNAVNPVHPQPLTCNDQVFILLSYDGYNFRLNFNNVTASNLQFDLITTGPFPLDLSSSYYFGLSGSVGNGYYEQVSNYVYLRGFN